MNRKYHCKRCDKAFFGLENLEAHLTRADSYCLRYVNGKLLTPDEELKLSNTEDVAMSEIESVSDERLAEMALFYANPWPKNNEWMKDVLRTVRELQRARTEIATLTTSAGPWRKVANTDMDWRCIHCNKIVSVGPYPSNFFHTADCTYSMRPFLQRAEDAEATGARLAGELNLLRLVHDEYRKASATEAKIAEELIASLSAAVTGKDMALQRFVDHYPGINPDLDLAYLDARAALALPAASKSVERRVALMRDASDCTTSDIAIQEKVAIKVGAAFMKNLAEDIMAVSDEPTRPAPLIHDEDG